VDEYSFETLADSAQERRKLPRSDWRYNVFVGRSLYYNLLYSIAPPVLEPIAPVNRSTGRRALINRTAALLTVLST